jgi:hypothetical protein
MNEPDEAGMLEALRRDRDAPAPAEAMGRVAARLAMLRAPLPEPPRQTGSLAAVPAKAAATAVALAFAVGGAAGALIHARFARAPMPQVVYVDRPVPPRQASPSPNAASELSGIAEPSAVATPRAPTREAPSSHPHLSQLDAERGLLDVARAALVRGDTSAALEALDQHARTFAHALLAEERDALYVQALARAGRYEEARARAEAFRRTSPTSLLLPAVEAATASGLPGSQAPQ